MSSTYKLYYDGASKSNPGVSAGAYILYKDDKILFQGAKYLPKATNNIAEYTGILYGLKKAVQLGIKDLKVYGDSMLVTKQLNLEYKVKNEILKEYHAQCLVLMAEFDTISISHVYRDKNTVADALANLCIFSQCDL